MRHRNEKHVKQKISADELIEIIKEKPDIIRIPKSVAESTNTLKRTINLIKFMKDNNRMPKIKITTKEGIDEII